jgi:protein gp37
MRPDLTFQLLTKRPERMRAYLTKGPVKRYWNGLLAEWRELEDMPRESAIAVAAAVMSVSRDGWIQPVKTTPWPLPNVWLGVSVENQAAADDRIPDLLDTPAAVRFLSCEPLLEELSIFNSPSDADAGAPVGLIRRDVQLKPHDVNGPAEYDALWEPGIDWVIVGGESGPGARPCDVGWIRDIVQQCRAAGVPVFVKQLGARPVRTVRGSWINELQRHGPDIQQPYGRAACWACRTEECKLLWPGVPPHVKRWLPLRDRKGGDMSEWPEDLRVREYPS